MFQIEDTARKNLTQLKKGINFRARVTAVRSKHGDNRYLANCNEKLWIKITLMLFLSCVNSFRALTSIWNSRVLEVHLFHLQIILLVACLRDSVRSYVFLKAKCLVKNPFPWIIREQQQWWIFLSITFLYCGRNKYAKAIWKAGISERDLKN